MSEKHKQAIREGIAKAKETGEIVDEASPPEPVRPEIPVSQLPEPAPIWKMDEPEVQFKDLLANQPITTKEFDLAIRGIPYSESMLEGFVEPEFDGLLWKQDGRDPYDKGWYTVRMPDGSWNVIENH
jgi:hypothetical protein